MLKASMRNSTNCRSVMAIFFRMPAFILVVVEDRSRRSWQCQVEGLSLEFGDVGSSGVLIANNCWHKASWDAWNRFDRNPKWRILTKPFGSTCRKNRRKNSVPVSLIVRPDLSWPSDRSRALYL